MSVRIEPSPDSGVNYLTPNNIASSNPEEVSVQLVSDIQEQAAIKIQSLWKGYFTRTQAEKMRRPLLSYALLEKAKPYIDSPLTLPNIPTASSGRTRVYLPRGLPIVLKRSGFPKNQDRLEKMKQARQLCDKNGYQRLVIPKAQVYRGFIVESRLPIRMHGTKRQVGLYIENQQKFSTAVKEFVGLLCQSTMHDIVGGSTDPYGTLSKVPLGRYDNVALYLEEDQGNIGLIDLEDFSPNKGQTESFFSECCNAVYLFPYHLDEILSVVAKFDPKVETYRGKLEKERDKTLKFFDIAYQGHLGFITEKGITWENPTVFEGLGPDRATNLQDMMEMEVSNRNLGLLFEGCLGEKPEEALARFKAEAAPKILEAIYKLIRGCLGINLASNGGLPSSNPELLSIRTLEFGPEDEIYHDFVEVNSQLMSMLKFKNASQAQHLLSVLLNVVLKELQNGREIAYYNPIFGYSGDTTKCIFC